MYSGVSMEKYNIMKPSKMKKSTSTIKRLRNYIRTNGLFPHHHSLGPFRCNMGWVFILRIVWQLRLLEG